MIGNDIIDLGLAKKESNWQRRGYLDKLFTSEEQELITASNDPFQTVWLLWSMKESAWKAQQQKEKKRLYAPKKYRCSLFNKSRGQVLTDSEVYFTISEVNAHSIHTIATSAPDIRTNFQYFEVQRSFWDSISTEVRSALLMAMASEMEVPADSLELRKDKDQFPQIYLNEELLATAVSLSHHGDFAAFCFQEKD